MAFDLKRFKKINDRHKLTVFGFIKDFQSIFPSDNPYYQIHDLIIQICTLFYASIHEWDLDFMGPYVQFIEETNSIKQIKFGYSSSSFLKHIYIDAGFVEITSTITEKITEMPQLHHLHDKRKKSRI